MGVVVNDTDFLIIAQRIFLQAEVGDENHEFVFLRFPLPGFEQIAITAVCPFEYEDDRHLAHIAGSRNVIVDVYRTVGKRRIILVGEFSLTGGKNRCRIKSGAEENNAEK